MRGRTVVIPEHGNWNRHQNRGCGITLYSSIFNYVWQDGVHRLLDCKLALSKMIGNPRQIARTYQSLCTKVGKLAMILSKDPQIIHCSLDRFFQKLSNKKQQGICDFIIIRIVGVFILIILRSQQHFEILDHLANLMFFKSNKKSLRPKIKVI